LLAREHAADRIVRIAEQEEARALADPRRERVDVDLVAAVGAARERRLFAREPDAAGRAEDRRIDRRLEDQPRARGRPEAAGHVEARDDARDDPNCIRRDAPAVPLEQPIGEELVEFWLLEGQVAEDTVLDPLAERADNRLG